MPSYELSTDKSRLDIDIIHSYLRESYWSPGVTRAVVERAIEGSLCFGVYRNSDQVGFARVITDKATFAYLADVFILEPHRGQGLSKRLIQFILDQPELQGLRRILLATRDAHGLYAQYGFTPLSAPVTFMEILQPKIYLSQTEAANIQTE